MKANIKSKLVENDKGYVKVVGGLVALLIMIIIGVLVFWEVNDAITLSSDTANDSRNTTTNMATTVFGLLPLIALVVVAAIILGVILAFGGGKTGRV
jgi:small-conductance mechanosensitive channel